MSEQLAPEISDYGLIGNCRSAALVSKHGSIDWCCFPKFDSPSYFARILGAAGGHFQISPVDRYTSEQAYVENTNVLETKFRTSAGSASLIDLFAVRDDQSESNSLWPDQEILRQVEVISGSVEFVLRFEPRAHYGKKGISLRPIGDWGIQCNHGRKLLLLQSSLKVQMMKQVEAKDGVAIEARFRLQEGERLVASLTYADEAPAVIPPVETAPDRIATTIRYWKGWSDRCNVDGPYSNLVRRSALALKLLNYAPSGAFVAAPTTSLPEWKGGSRNWDYRFCWLRDASFTTRAFLALGYVEEAESYLNWLLHSTRLSWPKLKVLYSVYGEARIKEERADWLSGFASSQPVRLGNEASGQTQLDVYGEVVDSFFSVSKHLDRIDRETKKMVIGFGRAVAGLWDKPDHGIWEFRGKPRHYTHSKVMCWVAVDRLSKLAERYGWKLGYDANEIAARIRGEIELKGFNSDLGCYTRAFGEPVVDASLLVMPLVGYCEPKSPRFQSTQKAIIRTLGKNHLIYRYPPGSDGMPEPEGTFTICNFWLSESFALQGRLEEAEVWLRSVLDRLPDTGLASEELDPVGNGFLGNHPQGFSHIGLIHAALAMQEARGLRSDTERKATA